MSVTSTDSGLVSWLTSVTDNATSGAQWLGVLCLSLGLRNDKACVTVVAMRNLAVKSATFETL